MRLSIDYMTNVIDGIRPSRLSRINIVLDLTTLWIDNVNLTMEDTTVTGNNSVLVCCIVLLKALNVPSQNTEVPVYQNSYVHLCTCIVKCPFYIVMCPFYIAFIAIVILDKLFHMI